MLGINSQEFESWTCTLTSPNLHNGNVSIEKKKEMALSKIFATFVSLSVLWRVRNPLRRSCVSSVGTAGKSAAGRLPARCVWRVGR